MELSKKIYIAGHKGLAGSAILRQLQQAGYNNLVYRTHAELDLTQQTAVNHFFQQEKPDYVFLAAAKVGGIHANNTYRGEFIYHNLAIQMNVIEAARQSSVKRLLFFGSTCAYPRECPQPMKEEYLLTGPIEPTNEPYGVAKIAGIKMCEAYNAQYGTQFTTVMPTNLFGINDNFDLQNSHVLPALIRKVHDAKINHKTSISIWGSGNAKREFMYIDDLASACLFIMSQPNCPSLLNIGTGNEVTIRELIELVCQVVGYQGEIIFDTSKPDGAPRKLVDSNQLTNLGWKAQTTLQSGLEETYRWFLTTDYAKEMVYS